MENCHPFCLFPFEVGHSGIHMSHIISISFSKSVQV